MENLSTRHWWKFDESDKELAHGAIVAHGKALREISARERWLDRIYEGIYENRVLAASGPYREALSLLRQSGFTAARLNVSRSIVETLVAKIGKKKPAIKTKALDVDYSFKRRARNLSRFVRGKQEDMEIHENAPMCLLDACVVGDGVIKVYPEHGDMVAERTPKEELFVNPREARYGNPRQLFQRKLVSREVLAESKLFSRYKAEIMQAATATNMDDDYEYEDAYDDDMIEVWEAWHLPSSPDADDGRHGIAIENTMLYWGEWKRARFPFAWLRYAKRRRGWNGRGLIADLAEIQYKINDTVRDIQDALYFGSQLTVFVARGSGITRNHLGRQQRAHMLEVNRPNDVQYVAPNPVSKDAMMFLKELINWAYEFTGISQMSAQAKNPLGAGASGVALDNFYDLESERYATIEQNYARFHVDIAEIMIDCAKEISETPEADVRARWHERDVMQSIKWKDVDMKRDQFRLTLEPANFLPDSRAGQLQAAEQLSKAGVIQGPQVSMLLGGFPDLERVNRLRNAPYEHCEWIMEQLQDEDVDEAELLPDGFINLDLAMDMAKSEYARAVTEDAPPVVLERFRNYIFACDQAMKKAQQAMPIPGPQGETPPEGMPPEMMPPGAGPMPPGGMAPPVAGALPPGPAPEALPGEALPGA